MFRIRIIAHNKYNLLLLCLPILLGWSEAGNSIEKAKSAIQSAPPKENPRLNLTDAEKKWLKEHPTINVIDDFSWPPYIYRDNDGNLAGIASSYIALFTKKLGTQFTPQFNHNWEEAIDYFKSGKSDLLPALVRTEQREAFIRFTKPYISFPVVVATRNDSPFIDSLENLAGKRVGLVKGYLNEDRLTKGYVDLKVVPLLNVATGVLALADGKVDAFVGNLGVIYYEMHRLNLDSIKIAAPTPYIDDLSFGVRKDWPELVSILNKTLATITDREKSAIKNDWIGITVKFGTKLSTILIWLVPTLLITFGIISFVLIWNRRLEREVAVRQRTERALKIAKESAEKASLTKTTFLANMSHELRTPLNAILGFSRMMGQDSDATTHQLDRLAIINRSGEHLLEMINEVLDLSKIEAGQMNFEPRDFDLKQLLEDISCMFEVRTEEVGLIYKKEIDAGLARYIEADAGKIRQILINLLGNAVKFTPGGYVSLRANTVLIQDDPEKSLLQLEVEDSGRGISSEQLEQIFQPFIQAGNYSYAIEGSGLGLTISKSFIELMNGKIEVKSELGKGSLFKVELPIIQLDELSPEILKPFSKQVVNLEPNQPAWRILVVEDNLDNQLLLSDFLTQVGFNVQQAENGQQAVSLFKQWRPHFIWMDLRMPIMNGYEATRQIRDLPDGNDVRIVALTASIMPDSDLQAIDAGCDDLMRKPFLEQDVFQCIEDQLGVKYVFNEIGTQHASPQSNHKTNETEFSSINKTLNTQLCKAVENKNDELMNESITKLRKTNPAMAELLTMLAKDQRYDQILELLN